MEGNDLLPYIGVAQATMFEGVLASPPEGVLKNVRYKRLTSRDEWDEAIRMWTPHEMPLKSLADCVNRRGLGTEVYTYLPLEATDAIGKWLVRKGISVPIYSFMDVSDLLGDFRMNRAVRVLYTGNYDDACLIGPRATVVSSNQAWLL